MPDPFTIPELTRGLRAFASPAALGSAHDRFFGPLLDARRGALRVSRWDSRLSAFDADRIGATMRAVLSTLAAERHPSDAAEQRALGARLADACQPAFNALADVGVLAEAVRGAPDDAERAALWPPWVAGLQAAFAESDRAWEHVQAILSGAPAPGPERRRTAGRVRAGRGVR